MAGGIIKTTLALDGEQRFKQGLQNIDSEIRVMNAEIKNLTSNYNSNAKSVKSLSDTQNAMQKKIELSKTKISSLKEAISTSNTEYKKAVEHAEEMAEKFGKNSKEALLAEKAVAKAGKELDGYRIKLANAENDLNKNTAALEKFNKENGKTKIGQAFTAAKAAVSDFTAKLQPALDKVKSISKAASNITFKTAEASAKAFSATVGTAVSGGVKAVTAYTGAVAGSATALYNLTANAALAADDINTLATQTGLSTEQIQKFQYASDLIDVDLDTLTGSMAKLTKNMNTAQKGTGDAAVAFQALGISITDSNGELRNNQDVFNEAIKALGEMENETQRDAYAMSIFGKSAQDLNPLIKGGADALAVLGKNASDAGMILSADALSELNEFNDSIDVMKANVGAAGNVLAVGFAGSFKQFTDLIGSNVPGLVKSLSAVFSGDKIESKNFGEKLSNFAKEFLTKISQMLPDFVSGINTIVTALGTAFMDTLPVMFDDVIPTMIAGAESLTLSVVDALPTFLPMIINGGATLFNGLLTSLNNVVNALIPQLPTIIDNITTAISNNAPVLLSASLTLFEGIITALGTVAKNLMPKLPGIISDICDTLIDHIDEIIDAGFELLIGLADGIIECIPTLLTKIPEVITKLVGELTKSDNLTKLLNAGITLIVELAKGLPQAAGAIAQNVPIVVANIIDTIMSTNWFQVGADIVSGILQGFNGSKGELQKNADAFANDLVVANKKSAKINSPSKLFRDEIGKPLAEGVEVGYLDNLKKITAKIPESFDTITSASSKYVELPSTHTIATQPNYSAGSPVINITIQNASLASDSDITRTAQMLALEEQAQRAALGLV